MEDVDDHLQIIEHDPLAGGKTVDRRRAYAMTFPQSRLDPSPEEAEEWTAMVHPDLLRQRLDALELLNTSLARATEHKKMHEIALSPDDVQAWLGVLNDTRLVLGTRLGVTEDEPEFDLDAPEARGYAIYYWLTALQGDLIDMLL